MIEEIKRRLENGEVVELECVDLNKFLTEELNCKTRYNKKCMAEFNSLVDEVSDAGVTMEDGFFIDDEELKYFRIKEEVPYIEDNPTFNDLIDVAVKAAKDGLINIEKINSDEIHYKKEKGSGGRVPSNAFHPEYNVFEYHIVEINSLYTETFVIEDEEDTLKIDTSGGEIIKVVLANNEVLSSNYLDCLCDISDGFRFKILKGATVTQKRGK